MSDRNPVPSAATAFVHLDADDGGIVHARTVFRDTFLAFMREGCWPTELPAVVSRVLETASIVIARRAMFDATRHVRDGGAVRAMPDLSAYAEVGHAMASAIAASLRKREAEFVDRTHAAYAAAVVRVLELTNAYAAHAHARSRSAA